MIQTSAAFVVVSYGDEIAWDPSVLPQHVRVMGYSSAARRFLVLNSFWNNTVGAKSLMLATTQFLVLCATARE